MTDPVISIVMPLFNKGNDVARAIASVLYQTVKKFELIIVDDGSTDSAPEVINSIDDLRVRFVRQTHGGVSAARNHGIRLARADLIAFIDADDEWRDDFLETILHLREKYPQCSVFATSYLFGLGCDKFQHPTHRGLPPPPWEGVIEDYFAVAANSDTPVCSSAVAVRKEAILAVGGFPPGIDTGGEDLLTWARLAVRYPIAYRLEPKAIYWKATTGEKREFRVPDPADRVGKELEKIYHSSDPPVPASFRHYIAMWHKIRLATFYWWGWKEEAVREIDILRRYSSRNLRFYCLILPRWFPAPFFQLIRLFYRWKYS